MTPLDVPRALLDGEKVVKWDDVSTYICTITILRVECRNNTIKRNDLYYNMYYVGKRVILLLRRSSGIRCIKYINNLL